VRVIPILEGEKSKVGVTMDKRRTFRKVGRMGNSPGISLPPEYLEKLNIQRGEECEIIFDEKRKEIRIRPVRSLPEGISEDFLRILDDVLIERDEVFRNLKDR
jgi:antitoxin MazE